MDLVFGDRVTPMGNGGWVRSLRPAGPQLHRPVVRRLHSLHVSCWPLSERSTLDFLQLEILGNQTFQHVYVTRSSRHTTCGPLPLGLAQGGLPSWQTLDMPVSSQHLVKSPSTFKGVFRHKLAVVMLDQRKGW